MNTKSLVRKPPFTLTSCDYCKGPCNWTLDKDGEVWFYCKAECDGFLQMELFSDDVFVPGDHISMFDQPTSVRGRRDSSHSECSSQDLKESHRPTSTRLERLRIQIDSLLRRIRRAPPA